MGPTGQRNQRPANWQCRRPQKRSEATNPGEIFKPHRDRHANFAAPLRPPPLPAAASPPPRLPAGPGAPPRLPPSSATPRGCRRCPCRWWRAPVRRDAVRAGGRGGWGFRGRRRWWDWEWGWYGDRSKPKITHKDVRKLLMHLDTRRCIFNCGQFCTELGKSVTLCNL